MLLHPLVVSAEAAEAVSCTRLHLLVARYCCFHRCVYELATFCKAHKDELSKRLLLLSISWASVLSPFKDPELTGEERDAFRNFHCRDARCFKPSDRAYVLKAIRD